MKKLFSIITGLFLMFGMVAPTYAVEPASIKYAFGTIKYTAYSTMQRTATFNVVNFANSCSLDWNVTNSYVVAFMLDGDTTAYAHDATLTQTGSTVSGTGGYPTGGPHSYTWHVTGGTVTGNNVSLNVLYDTGAAGTVMTMTGTIAPDGTMSGTWTDDFGGTRNGTWSTTSGAATKTVGAGCTGQGIFSYSDASRKYYLVDVKYVNVSGNKVWFAGPVVMGNIGTGSWLFAEAEDISNPLGAGMDKIWGSFTTEALAKLGVATMANPTDGPFTISAGNLKVN